MQSFLHQWAYSERRKEHRCAEEKSGESARLNSVKMQNIINDEIRF